MAEKYDLLIIGGGPAGYEGAAIAAAKGLNVALIERDKLGGTCLNRGCIPTKCLLHSAAVGQTFDQAQAHSAQVMDQLRDGISQLLRGVEVISGDARFTAERTVAVGDRVVTADRIIIATGSEPARLPIEGAEYAITSDEALALAELPKSMVVIGGGVIGIELTSALAGFGVEVTVIEYCKEILPGLDSDLAKRLRQLLGRRGITIHVGAGVSSVATDGTVTFTGKKGEQTVKADKVLMAVGRRPVIPQGIELAGIEAGRRGITVDDDFATTAQGVYAVGDVNGRCMLAHAASAQMKRVLGEEVNLDVMPSVVFTTPEFASVGLTEEACKERGIEYKAVKTMVASSGKALASGCRDGVVKMIVSADGAKILGAAALAPHADDILQEVVLAMANGLGPDAIRRTIHPHPTLNELILATAEKA